MGDVNGAAPVPSVEVLRRLVRDYGDSVTAVDMVRSAAKALAEAPETMELELQVVSEDGGVTACRLPRFASAIAVEALTLFADELRELADSIGESADRAVACLAPDRRVS